MDYHFNKETKSLSIVRYTQGLFHHRAILLLHILGGTLHFKIPPHISALGQKSELYNYIQIIFSSCFHILTMFLKKKIGVRVEVSTILKCYYSLTGIMWWYRNRPRALINPPLNSKSVAKTSFSKQNSQAFLKNRFSLPNQTGINLNSLNMEEFIHETSTLGLCAHVWCPFF